MKILIYGDGWLGNKYARYLGAEISDLRINCVDDVKRELEKKHPSVVINCAGKTGRPNIDWCEDNKLETMIGNVAVPLILAQACNEKNVYFVHLSSGCIYDGDNQGRGFSETDVPNFKGSFYSRSKIICENGLKEFPALMIRLRMPVDDLPGERNFLTKITKYSKVINVPNSMTVIDDLLVASKKLIEKSAVGIYNVTNSGIISHKEIIDMYKEIVDSSHACEFISLTDLEKLVKAPRSNCVLNTAKLENEGIYLRPVRDAVQDCLIKYRNIIDSNNWLQDKFEKTK